MSNETENSVVTGMISIIIPTYNRSSMLKEAIDSVLMQTYKNYEIIVVDDCSTDDSEKMVEAYTEKIRYVCNDKNQGAGYSRKHGYQICRGEYIIFMDDDDFYTDEKFFAIAINQLKKDNMDEVAFISANSFIGYSFKDQLDKAELNLKGYINGSEYLRNFQFAWRKPNSTFTTIFLRISLEKSDFTNMKMVNDSSIYMRALLAGDAYILQEFVGVYRMHQNNISSDIKSWFLIENMEEKKYVYEKIKEQKLFEDYSAWWLEQTRLTVKYYAQGTKPKIHDYSKVYIWCVKNSEAKIEIIKILTYYFCYLVKYKLKIKLIKQTK